MLLLVIFFFSSFFSLPIYKQTVNELEYGYEGELTLESGEGPYGSDAQTINFEVEFISDDIIRIKYYDPSEPTTTVPHEFSNNEIPPPKLPSCIIEFDDNFGFAVRRKEDNELIFDCRQSTMNNTIIYEKQYVEFNISSLSSNPIIYGLGQRRTSFRLPFPFTYAFDNQDRGTPPGGENLYSSHPFFIQRLDNSLFHGLFLSTPIPLSLSLSSSSFTYKLMKGPLEFYLFSGGGMKKIINRYSLLLGKPLLLPRFSLSINLCRWGWKTLEEVKEVVNKHREKEIPLDIVWGDIDYMDKYFPFTTSPSNYPSNSFKEWIEELHNDSIREIVIVDPGIAIPDEAKENNKIIINNENLEKINSSLSSSTFSNLSLSSTSYPIYDQLLSSSSFFYNRTNQPFIGSVWPGDVLFPDFSNNKGGELWMKWIKEFVEELKVDGIWIDMNEIANFNDGEKEPDPSPPSYPFAPDDLYFHRPPPSLITNMGEYIYTHNFYSLLQSFYTYSSLLSLHPSLRPFILSRASFPGQNKFSTVWLGDNSANWKDLSDSFSSILSQSLFLYPVTGADIGGFNIGLKNNSILITRWIEAATFLYPFFRMHSSNETVIPNYYYIEDSDILTEINKKYLHIRHSLILFYNTLMILSHSTGIPIIRSLVMEFPSDPNTISIDSSAFLGSSLLSFPPTRDEEQDKIEDCYIPYGRWYDFFTLEERKEIEVERLVNYSFPASKEERERRKLVDREKLVGKSVTLEAPLDTIPVFMRGGTTLIRQLEENVRYELMKDSPITIYICLDEREESEGDMIDDDGISIDKNGNTKITHAHISFTPISHPSFTHRFSIYYSPYQYNSKLTIESIKILGMEKEPKTIYSSTNHSVKSEFDADKNILTLTPDGWEKETIGKKIDIYFDYS